jgi:hypothetical protein
LRRGGNQKALITFAGNNYFAILATFEHSLKTVQPQVPFLALSAMTPEAGNLQ